MAHCQKVQWTERNVVIELLFDNMIVRARGDTIADALTDLVEELRNNLSIGISDAEIDGVLRRLMRRG